MPFGRCLFQFSFEGDGGGVRLINIANIRAYLFWLCAAFDSNFDYLTSLHFHIFSLEHRICYQLSCTRIYTRISQMQTQNLQNRLEWIVNSAHVRLQQLIARSLTPPQPSGALSQ